jgi:hypothetical protein
MLDCAAKRVAFHADQARRLSPQSEPVASNGKCGVSGEEIIHVQRGLKIIHAVVEQQRGWSHDRIRDGGKNAGEIDAL